MRIRNPRPLAWIFYLAIDISFQAVLDSATFYSGVCQGIIRGLRMVKVKLFVHILLCFLLMGCAAPLVFFGAGAAAGVAGYKYYEGALTVIFQSPFMETWDATLKGLNQLNIKVESSSHDIASGKIKAKRGDNQRVAVSLKYKSAQETEVVIMVGALGDKNASMAIKEEIRKVLVKE